jgi:hypothetical protein
MAQNPLHGLVSGPSAYRLNAIPATEPVPAIPPETNRLDCRTNHPLRQLVHVHPFPVAMVEHDSGGGMVHGRVVLAKLLDFAIPIRQSSPVLP